MFRAAWSFFQRSSAAAICLESSEVQIEAEKRGPRRTDSVRWNRKCAICIVLLLVMMWNLKWKVVRTENGTTIDIWQRYCCIFFVSARATEYLCWGATLWMDGSVRLSCLNVCNLSRCIRNMLMRDIMNGWIGQVILPIADKSGHPTILALLWCTKSWLQTMLGIIGNFYQKEKELQLTVHVSCLK
jgi:hypothetical protein